MAKLVLDCNVRSAVVQPLREWLAGDWALVFSHPDDFAHPHVEADRWCTLVAQALEHAGVRAIELVRQDCDARSSWLSQLRPARATLTLADAHRTTKVVCFPRHPLREALARAGERFAMIVDATLRPRRTYVYGAGESLLSIFDLLGLAMRARADFERRAPCEAHLTRVLSSSQHDVARYAGRRVIQ